MSPTPSSPVPSTLTVALAGNPNSGKTTLFNALTGARAHVGNYPGVTVDIAEGTRTHNGRKFRIIDLPGTYSLAAASPEEAVARDFLLRQKPDVVIQVVDATNLERNLYLAVQMRELGARLVVALNMTDVADARGISVDVAELSKTLSATVVPTVSTKGIGLDRLMDAAAEAAARPAPAPLDIGATGAMADGIAALVKALPKEEPELAAQYPNPWLAARLLENETELLDRVKSPALRTAVADWSERIRKEQGDDPAILLASTRYGWIADVASSAVKAPMVRHDDFSDRLDRILLHRVLGLPLFLLFMYLVFQLVFTLGDPPMGWIETGFERLGDWVRHLWPKDAESPLRDLLVDGLIGGLGGVIVFLPNIILLFLAIAILEGSGYMARAAFLIDRIMRKIGLHGKSFIPMLLGFGCTVPAIMGTRTIENRRDRFATILVLPFMSCGARLPIYALLIPAFFPGPFLSGAMLWLIYFIGIVMAIVAAKLLRSTILKGEAAPFVMELPPYRVPTFRSVILLMWDRAKEYLKKAGTIILAACIILWAMATYPKKETYSKDYEALTAEVDNEYFGFAGELGNTVGLGMADGKPLLAAWAEADVERRAGEASHWEDSKAYADSQDAYAKAVEQLSAGAGGPKFAAFLAALEAIDEAEGAFEEATAELEEYAIEPDEEKNIEGVKTAEWLEAEKERDEALAKIGETDADAYRLATKFRDEPRADWEARRTELADSQMGEDLSYSISGRIGRALEPVIRPMGFDWKIGTALVGALAAKEVFVAQMGIVYSAGEADENSETLRETLKSEYSPRQAFAIMLFCLLSAPCVATIAVCKRETHSWKYAIGMLIGLTAVAYIVTTLFYQISGLF